jgi:hypothetical protein
MPKLMDWAASMDEFYKAYPNEERQDVDRPDHQ